MQPQLWCYYDIKLYKECLRRKITQQSDNCHALKTYGVRPKIVDQFFSFGIQMLVQKIEFNFKIPSDLTM